MMGALLFSTQEASAEVATFCSWNTTNETLGSDHCLISIDVQLSNPYPAMTTKKRFIPRNLDLKKFHDKIDKEDSAAEVNFNSNLDRYEYILQLIQKFFVVEQNINKETRCNPIWWTTDCSRAVAKRRRVLSIFNKKPTYANLLKDQEKATKKILNDTKKDSWKSFCESLTAEATIPHLWKTIKIFRNTSIQDKFFANVAGPVIVLNKCPEQFIGPVFKENDI